MATSPSAQRGRCQGRVPGRPGLGGARHWLGSVLLLVAGAHAWAQAALWNEDFEGYAAGTLIHGQAGWGTQPERGEEIVVRDAAYGSGWGAHGKYLVVNGSTAFATLPALDTRGAGAVRLSLDVRPGDAVCNGDSWGALLYCYAADGGIVSVKFAGSGRPNSGPIQVTDGGADHYVDTGCEWAYRDHTTSYHLDLLLNQTRFNRTWELQVDGGAPVRGDWGAFFGSPLGSGTLARVVLRGGHNLQPEGLVAFDNLTVTAVAPRRPVGGNPEVVGTRIAQYLDECYYASGTRVDLAGLDLEECRRQGRGVPARCIRRVERTAAGMRHAWLALEQERQTLAAAIRLTPANPGTHQLRIENLGQATAGDSGWFGLRWAALRYPDGTRVPLPAALFKGGAFMAQYAYQCEPAPAAFVHGQAALTHTTIATFDLPRPPEVGMELEISGLDDDKPGAVPLRLALNGVTLFSGANPFRENGWSEQRFAIPLPAWEHPRPSAGTPETRLDELAAWLGRVEAFAEQSQRQAQALDEWTQTWRRDLVWQKRSYPPDGWKHGFVRGLCLESDKGAPPDAAGRPWFDDSFEYVAKALTAAQVNLLYLYPADPPVYPLLAEHNRRLGLPVVECRWELAHPREPGAPFYLDADPAVRDTLAYVQALGQGDGELRGVALDEPRFDEFEDALARLPQVGAAFQAYLTSRRPALAEAGVKLPEALPPLPPDAAADRVLWMEWQYFKMDYLTSFYARLANGLESHGVLLLPIVQDYLAQNPQTAPYPPWGAKLPIVGTDLYYNGTIAEAYALDLLASTNAGRTLLVPGSGYSAKTPGRFRRTLANGLVRADGVLNWIYTYAGKYRPRYFFVRPNLKDDRGREALDNWRPEYWEIQTRMYQDAARADAYLADTASTADLAVLYSLRSTIAASAPDTPGGQSGYQNGLRAFSGLIALQRPLDGCMVEGLNAARLARYRVMYLLDAPALTPAETRMLADWVRAGGTLVVGANTMLQDPWGRPQADYSLAELFGLHFRRWSTGVSRLVPRVPPEAVGAPVAKASAGPDDEPAYSAALPYAQIELAGATVLCRWENGDPALLSRVVGEGSVYVFTARQPGYSTAAGDPRSGLYAEPREGGWPSWYRWIAARHGGTPALQLRHAPRELEVQVRRKGDACIVHLLDWSEDREVRGLTLQVNLPGTWRAHYPTDGTRAGKVRRGSTLKLRPLHTYDMIVLEPEP